MIDPNTIQLALAPTIAFGPYSPADPKQTATQTIGQLAQSDFDASAINTTTNQIQLTSLNGLKNGQSVEYLGSSDATARRQGPGVVALGDGCRRHQRTDYRPGKQPPGRGGGVLPGWVRQHRARHARPESRLRRGIGEPPDDYAQRPCQQRIGGELRSRNRQQRGQGSGPFTCWPPPRLSPNYVYTAVLNGTKVSVSRTDPLNNNAPITFTSQGSGNSGLTFQSNILKFNPATAVNTTSNTITVPSTAGYTTGDAVIYQTDPTIQAQQDNAPTVTDFNRQIIPVDAQSFELVGDQTAIAPPRAKPVSSDFHRREHRGDAMVSSASYSAATGLTTVMLGQAVIGSAAPSEADFTLASGATTTYTAGIGVVGADMFTLPGDQSTVDPVGSSVSLTLAGGAVVTANIDSVSYQPSTNLTTIRLDQSVITGGTPKQVVVTLTASVTQTFTSQTVPVDGETFELTGDQTTTSPMGSMAIVTFIDGSTATGTVSSAIYNAQTKLTTVVLDSTVFNGLIPTAVSIASPTSGTVTAFDNPIPGLENGFLYYGRR